VKEGTPHLCVFDMSARGIETDQEPQNGRAEVTKLQECGGYTPPWRVQVYA
jgi:hypothetical protein